MAKKLKKSILPPLHDGSDDYTRAGMADLRSRPGMALPRIVDLHNATLRQRKLEKLRVRMRRGAAKMWGV